MILLKKLKFILKSNKPIVNNSSYKSIKKLLEIILSFI